MTGKLCPVVRDNHVQFATSFNQARRSLNSCTVIMWCTACWGQANANPSPLFADEQVLGDEKVAPLAKGGVAFLFESNSGVDMPFEVEVIVYRRMDGNGFLLTSHAPEARHRPLSPSER
jgi:hypothetical protein